MLGRNLFWDSLKHLQKLSRVLCRGLTETRGREWETEKNGGFEVKAAGRVSSLFPIHTVASRASSTGAVERDGVWRTGPVRTGNTHAEPHVDFLSVYRIHTACQSFRPLTIPI